MRCAAERRSFGSDGRGDRICSRSRRSVSQSAGYALETGCDFTAGLNDTGAALLFRGSSSVDLGE